MIVPLCQMPAAFTVQIRCDARLYNTGEHGRDNHWHLEVKKKPKRNLDIVRD